MKTHDYVKYMTQEIIKKLDSPKGAGKQPKKYEPWALKWFGVLGYYFLNGR